jgi:hypothetical protein
MGERIVVVLGVAGTLALLIGLATEPERPVRRVRIVLHLPTGGPTPSGLAYSIYRQDCDSKVFPPCEFEDGVKRLELDLDPETSRIEVEVDGYLPVEIPLDLGDRTEWEAPPVHLDPGARIRLRVREREGAPAADLWVAARQPDVFQEAATDAEGRATLSGLQPGVPAEVLVGQVRWYREGVLPDPEKVLTVELEPPARVRGQVRFEDGLPAPRIGVVAARTDEAARAYFVHTDTAGRFELTLRPGIYEVRLRPQDWNLETEELRKSILLECPSGVSTPVIRIARPK